MSGMPLISRILPSEIWKIACAWNSPRFPPVLRDQDRTVAPPPPSYLFLFSLLRVPALPNRLRAEFVLAVRFRIAAMFSKTQRVQ